MRLSRALTLDGQSATLGASNALHSGRVAVENMVEPYWVSLRQEVWEQHLSCASREEAVAKAVALVDDRVGDLLAQRWDDRHFGLVTGALMTAAVEHYHCAWNVHLPDGFDASRYVPPVWLWDGVFAAHDRLNRWAGLALRFRGRPPTPPTRAR